MFQHISMDGVVQQSVDDDGFPYSNWSAPYRTTEGREMLAARYGERFDLLLGRRTYDQWSGFWPKAPSSTMGDRLNAATKFVVTERPGRLSWGPVEGVGPDIGESVKRIKALEGPDLILCGSTTLTSALFEHGLV